jgi:hypothetical protein
MPSDPAEALALWRYHLIAEALDPKLTGRERGLLVRRIAGEHATPAGDIRAVSRNTLDRWIRRYRARARGPARPPAATGSAPGPVSRRPSICGWARSAARSATSSRQRPDRRRSLSPSSGGGASPE